MSSFSFGGQVRANGIRQHYLHFPSTGPRIVIVPGIVSPAVLWSHVGEWLAQRFDCYVLDVRGRGLSESGVDLAYSFDACAQDVSAFVNAMALGPVLLIGHSMGARIGLRAATLAPKLFNSLVLVDPPTSGPGRRPYPIPMERTLGLLEAAKRGEGLEALRASPAAAWPDELQRLRNEWLPTCDERAVRVAYEEFHGTDMFSDFARTRVPVSMIYAPDGGVVSAADAKEFRELRADVDVVPIAGVGHQMQAEDFGAFSKVLDQVLRRHFQNFEGAGVEVRR